MTLTTAISAPAQIVNGDASMDQQLAQKCAEDAEAYGFVPSFVLIAEMCSSIGGLNWYSRKSAAPGQTRTRRGDSDSVNPSLNPGPPASIFNHLEELPFRLGTLGLRDQPRLRSILSGTRTCIDS